VSAQWPLATESAGRGGYPVQKGFYEDVPAIRYGDIFGFRAMQASVKGFNEHMSFYRFYNVWPEK
jgi:hypothetical protein